MCMEGPLLRLPKFFRSAKKHGRQRRTQFNIGPYGKSIYLLSPLKLLKQIVPNFTGIMYEGPLLRLSKFFRSAKKHGRQGQTQFNIGPYGKNTFGLSSLKLLKQMEPNFTRMMYGRTSTKITQIFPIRQKHGRQDRTQIKLDPMGKTHFDYLL